MILKSLIINFLIIGKLSSPMSNPSPTSIDEIDECGITVIATVKNCAAGKSDGEIELKVEGGIAPYQFFWIGNISNPSEKINKIQGLSIGYYSVVVVDKNRCSKTLMNIKVDLKSNNE